MTSAGGRAPVTEDTMKHCRAAVRSAVHAGETSVAAAKLGLAAAPATVAVQAATAIIVAGLPVGTAWSTRSLVDGIVTNQPAQAVGLAASMLVAIGVGQMSLNHVSGYLSARFARAVALRAQDRLFAAVGRQRGLRRLESPEFHDRLRLAQQSGAAAASGLVTDLTSLGASLLTVAALLGSVGVLNPVLALLIVGAMIPTMTGEIMLARRRAALIGRLSPIERRELFYSSLLSDLDAAKEIRLYGVGDFLRERMRRERLRGNALLQRQDGQELRVHVLLGVATGVATGAGMLWAALAAARHELTVGDVTMFIAAVAGVQGALTTASRTVARNVQQVTLFDHFLAVVREPPDLSRPVAARPLPRLSKGIEFRDVWFRYNPEQDWILRGASLFIPAGATVALAGRNGSGKSTLIKLLCRMYDPDCGTITWDDIDLREVEPEHLRARIGAVFQDFAHYDLSAAENVAIGDITRVGDRAAIATAASAAGVHDTVVALPHGYDTPLTLIFQGRDDAETGIALSGGQWQRIAIARSMMRAGRDVMILDEPSSGLDAVAEHEVHRMVTEHCTGSTRILVSHRMGALRDADLISVLAHGRVVEQGTHAELLAEDGEYATLFRTQARGYTTALAQVQS